jgi:hypothetical protein
MLEKLAGRLKWERTGDSIRVVIPVRFQSFVVLSGMGVISLPFCVVAILDKLRGFNAPVPLATVWVGLSLGVIQMTIFFTAKHVLTLSPVEMAIQSRTLGIGVKKRSYATSRLRNLRFVASEYYDLVSTELNTMSRIELDRDGKTRKLAFGITEQEAHALIEKMMEVYDFSKDATR